MPTYNTNKNNGNLTSRDLQIIHDILSEYLGSYRLFGFDYNGNYVILTNESSSLENMALTSLIEEFIYQPQSPPEESD
ncbi:MAG: hypothetical protein ACP6IQ_02220 [Candidatus Njordarchaeia archaeon]